MKKWALSGVLLLTTVAASTTAFAARHHFDVIGESYGRSSEEAIDNACATRTSSATAAGAARTRTSRCWRCGSIPTPAIRTRACRWAARSTT